MNSLNILTNEQQRRIKSLRSQHSKNKDVIEWLQLELLWSQAGIITGVRQDEALLNVGRSNAMSALILMLKNFELEEGGVDE